MAYAKLGTLHPKLMDAVADAVLALEQPFAASLNPQDVANLAWSFSKLGCKKKRLFDALSAAFVAHLRDDDDSFSSQQLTMIVCAFGLLGLKDESMLNAAMGAMSKERVAEFNPRDLTNTAWALAALGVNAEAKPKLVERIGRTARKRLDDFNSQELLKFLGAFERLGGSDVRLARAVSKQRILSYEFPALSTHVPSSSSVKLSSKTRRVTRAPIACAWTTAAGAGAGVTREWRCGKAALCCGVAVPARHADGITRDGRGHARRVGTERERGMARYDRRGARSGARASLDRRV